jgi:hypothetical protein
VARIRCGLIVATVGAYSENANTLSEMLNDGEIRRPQPVGNHQRRLPGIVGDPSGATNPSFAQLSPKSQNRTLLCLAHGTALPFKLRLTAFGS